jgi:hypothetical protein
MAEARKESRLKPAEVQETFIGNMTHTLKRGANVSKPAEAGSDSMAWQMGQSHCGRFAVVRCATHSHASVLRQSQV